jgi:pyruvate/2-oxoglutarate dehydrogenase complex dihydrolipoamide dehydrogenase (E3) component
MVASAYAAQLARRAAEYGVSLSREVSVDMARVKARKNAIMAKSRDGLTGSLEGAENCALIRGHARFRSSHEVAVADQVLEAPRIFINVGGRASIPDLPGVERTPYLTSSSILDLEAVPEHLVVIGGSYIGLEFGQMFRRFGSRVTVVEMGPRLIGREDEDVSDAIREILESEGVEVRLNARCIALKPEREGAAVSLDCRGGPPEVTGSHLLLAVGRRPNTDDLGLEAAGVRTDARGYIEADDELRTNVEGIWALGDCNGKGAFTHTAWNDYEIVAANLLDGASRRVSDRITAYALFIDPPLGRVGLTEAQARKGGRPVLVGKRPMTRVARAVEKGEAQGFMKLIADAETKQLLGAAILGPGGDEAVHACLDLMAAKAPFTVMQQAMHIHPTVAELLPTVLGELKPAG